MGTNWFSEIHTHTHSYHTILVDTYWWVLTGFLGINQTPTHRAFFESTYNWFSEISTCTHHTILVDTYWWVLVGFLGINHTPTHIDFLEGTNSWVLTGSQKFRGPPPQYFLAWCPTPKYPTPPD